MISHLAHYKWPLFASLALALFLVDCKKNIVDPPVAVSDTTSHNFSLTRVDTLGSIFSIVAGVDIVDENNIWAAGIFTWQGDTGETHYDYNLAHWNGTKWQLMSVPLYGYNNTGPFIQMLGAVKVFKDSTIFVVAQEDNSTAFWDGTCWKSTYATGATISPHMWSRSSNDIYFVGRAGANGQAAHYDGNSFKKVITGLSDQLLTDVWGDEESVYALGTGDGPPVPSDAVFLSGQNLNWQIVVKYDVTKLDVNDRSLMGSLTSVYKASKHSKLWMLTGWGNARLFEINSLSPFTVTKTFDCPNDYSASLIRGTADNDLYIVSQRNSSFYHYNGSTWYRYVPPVNDFVLAYSTTSFAIKGNVWATVGFSTGGVIGGAIVIIGMHL